MNGCPHLRERMTLCSYVKEVDAIASHEGVINMVSSYDVR